MKVYLAAKFGHREYLETEVAPLIKDLGWEITSSWVFGGEEGLTRSDIAKLDLDDVDKADTLIIFTEEYQSHQPGGGRFVEMGYALGKGKRVIVVGDRENVFTHHTSVEVYPDLSALIFENKMNTGTHTDYYE